MESHDPVLQHFPLVARFRPGCLPLDERVQALVRLAEHAAAQADQGEASAVFNQSALVASDVGLADLARRMCHQHARAYLHACPLPAMSAIRALEPVVNLARLAIRAGNGDAGRDRLSALFTALGSGSAFEVDGLTVPRGLVAIDAARREVRAWLWRVLLADGTRTLTTSGRWAQARSHIESHRGIGARMLDGRQVAVITSLVEGDHCGAAKLLAATAQGEDWEQSVTALLRLLHAHTVGEDTAGLLDTLAQRLLRQETAPGMTVFAIRLRLSLLAIAAATAHPATGPLINDLHQRTLHANDGYAARDCLAESSFAHLASERQRRDCEQLVRACGLGHHSLPEHHHKALQSALDLSTATIGATLLPPHPASPQQ